MTRAECPLCGEAGKVVEFGMGDSWRNVLGKPPHSFFSTYQMVHAAPTANGIALFCHTEQDMQHGPPP